jgi:hypothetical protein
MENRKLHSNGFMVWGKEQDETQLITESDREQKQIEDMLKKQGARIAKFKREIEKKRFKNDLRIRTTIYYECDSPEDVLFGFKGYIPDSVRQVLKGAHEQINKVLDKRGDIPRY